MVRSCGAMMVLALAIAPLQAAEQRPDIARATTLVMQETNALRRAEGHDPVARNERLESTAHEFARFLARTGRFDHEADGHTPGERARRHGYRWCRISENIAYQYDSRGYSAEALAREIVSGWKKSAGHRRNMTDRDVVDTAVAIARASNGYYYAVQMFGKRC